MPDITLAIKDNVELLAGFVAGKVKWGNLIQKTYYVIEVLSKAGKASLWIGQKTKSGVLLSQRALSSLFRLVRSKVIK